MTSPGGADPSPDPSPDPSRECPILRVMDLGRNSDLVRRAGNLLRRGGLVAVPTEVGYLACGRADDPQVSARLAALPALPGVPPGPCLHDPGEVEAWAGPDAPEVGRLARVLWPGPLVMILRPPPGAPWGSGSGRGKVALRCPDQSLARSFLEQCGLPVLAAPLLGPLGAICQDGGEVAARFPSALRGVLEAPSRCLGLEETILERSSRAGWRILASGFTSAREVARILGRPPLLSEDLARSGSSAGWAPGRRLWLVEGEARRVARRLEGLHRAGVVGEGASWFVPAEVADLLGSLAEALRLQPFPGALEAGPGGPAPALLAGLDAWSREPGGPQLVVALTRWDGAWAPLRERLREQAHQVISTEAPGLDGRPGAALEA